MGRSIARALSAVGVRAIVVVDLPERERDLPAAPNVQFVPRNYLRLDRHDEVFAGVDSVIHLATDSHPEASMQDIERDAVNNIVPAIRILESCRHHSVRSVIFASSGGAIYGDSDDEQTGEDHPKAPMSAYGVVKLSIEHYLQLYHLHYGIRTYSLRIGNAYGPDQFRGAVIGSVANFMQKMARGRAIEVWGDGSIIRDYIYIDDIVKAYTTCVLGSGSLEPGNYNIGTGRGYSLRQVIDVIADVTGVAPDVRYKPGRPFDVHRIVLDPSKMQAASGWRAEIDLPAGVERMWRNMSASGG